MMILSSLGHKFLIKELVVWKRKLNVPKKNIISERGVHRRSISGRCSPQGRTIASWRPDTGNMQSELQRDRAWRGSCRRVESFRNRTFSRDLNTSFLFSIVHKISKTFSYIILFHLIYTRRISSLVRRSRWWCTDKRKGKRKSRSSCRRSRAKGLVFVWRGTKVERGHTYRTWYVSSNFSPLFLPSYNYISFAQLPGGSALESGKICKGDRVVAVGGQDVREAPVEDIAVHVKVSNPVQLKLARFKSAKKWQVFQFYFSSFRRHYHLLLLYVILKGNLTVQGSAGGTRKARIRAAIPIRHHGL